jgi:tyrosyl-tRNA synthetase
VLTTPILEGLDGVNKMSKSLGNAIGIHEAPLEMYGKVMSISDEMMWRYYELLTDVRVEQIAAMKADVVSGKSHPMALKKELARGIVADFHSAEAAAKAAEDWAKQFQKGEIPSDTECILVDIVQVKSARDISEEGSYFPLHKFQKCAPSGTFNKDDVRLILLDKLLFEAGLAQSRTEAGRKIKENAVQINGQIVGNIVVLVCHKEPITIRVGKKIKKVGLSVPS